MDGEEPWRRPGHRGHPEEQAFVRWSDLKTSRSATVAAVLTSDSQPSRIVLRTTVMPRR